MFEHQDGDSREEAALRGDPGRGPPGADGWGWDLVQRDWSLRQREPTRPGVRVLARIAARVVAVIARLRRLVRGAPHDRALDTSPPRF